MECKCNWFETIVALVILIVAIWPNLIGANASWWATVVLAVALLLHALRCNNCGNCNTPAAKPKAKKRKRK